jgi:hypothetical protein
VGGDPFVPGGRGAVATEEEMRGGHGVVRPSSARLGPARRL